MIIYNASKSKFVDDVFNGTIADDIDKAFVFHLGRHTSPNEVLSWKNSMMHMYKIMNTPDIPDDIKVAIEYQIPMTSKRIDFLISGEDEKGRGNIVIIELKQWEHVQLTSKPGVVRARFQFGEADTSHPSYQAWSYAYMLENYNETIRENNLELSPCAFLHNYAPDDVITNPFYQEYLDKAPVFLKNDARSLQNFVKGRIRRASKHDILWYIDNGKLRPSKQLADTLSSLLKGNQEFVMIDDQKVVFETAVDMAKRSQKDGQKRVLIVEGGAGTGKSVVAMILLVKLTNEGLVTQYVTKNAAPRAVYENKLRGDFRLNFIHNLFTGSGSFIEATQNKYGALIVDEAHRLNEKSGMYSNLGDNQIKEIINASSFSIFFVDDLQRIHVKDIGTKSSIKEMALSLGAKVDMMELTSQFRCNGSDGYPAWLCNALQRKETANIRLKEENYDFRIFDDPNELFSIIKEKNEIANRARMVAGYCWDWVSKNDYSKFDIEIPTHFFYKKWNLGSYGNLWIIDPNSINEIGCIHTCQGLELDYVGVIVGNDIRFENGRVVTDVTVHPTRDQSVKGLKSKVIRGDSVAIQDADEIIKNTYLTLMTRGMKGCYVFFCDKGLTEHFKNLMQAEEEETPYRIEPEVNDDVKYVDFLPLYSIRAACGYFGEGEDVELEGWMKVDGLGRLNRNMYVVKAVGQSMEPLIHDGDFCVFRANPSGSRQGKIVLAQHFNYYDADYSGSYSIKKYSSSKTFDSQGNWMHESIELMPLNKDYHSICITEENGEDFRIVGEFIGVINNN